MEEFDAQSITAIVFEEMRGVDQLQQRKVHDPDVIHRSFQEAQIILDSSPDNDEWGQLAAQQAAALVAVALASRFVENESSRLYFARVSERILALREVAIEWSEDARRDFSGLLMAARDRHDDDVLLWLKNRTSTA